jgi:SAM-dependent methyltransferase
MYRYKINEEENTVLEFETAENAFYPTETSTLLIQACRSNIKAIGKTLDLGCGIGITGLVISWLGLCAQPLFASDISEEAIKLLKKNAERLNIKIIARCGSLFQPWQEEKFDIVIDDVSGISDDVAEISPWFPPGVTCQAGRDGTRWIVDILKKAPQYLNQGGRLFFPILSLSNEEKILSVAKRNFSQVELLAEKEWFLPKQIIENIAQILPLIEDGAISCKNKFGTWVWTTKIFSASQC